MTDSQAKSQAGSQTVSQAAGNSSTHYDVLIIGSGFGGSTTALRLVEKGY